MQPRWPPVSRPMTAKATRDRTTEEIASSLLSASRVMNQVRVHEARCRAAGVDLDRSGAALLFKLYVEDESLRLTDLAERLGIDSPAVTRKVQQLERAGLLHRSPDPEDARAFRLALTAQGRQSIEALLEARQRWIDELLDGWTTADRKDFARLLTQFATTLAEDGEGNHGR